MTEMLASAAFHAYVCSAAFTVIKLVTLAFATIAFRTKSKSTMLPEDAAKFGSILVERDVPVVERIKRAHANALENELPFLAIGLVYVLVGASDTGAIVYFGVFIAARLLHTVFYLAKLQPFRSLMFAIGALALLGMAVGCWFRLAA